MTWVQLLSLATQKYLVCISDKCSKTPMMDGGIAFTKKLLSIGKVNEASW